MPGRVRRKLTSIAVAALTALATAGAAAAANGGFTPLTPNSPNAQRTREAYWVVFGFTTAIFLIVEGVLIVFIVRYRSRGRARTVEGAQVHGHTRLELIWTVIPVIILAIIGTVIFIELPSIADAPASPNPLRITVEGHQYYWQFDYPNGARSINTMVAPVDRVVLLTVKSADVVHSWWIPELGGKIQAIPGRTNSTWFKALRMGTFYGQCAELCGLYHASMKATVSVTSAPGYSAFVNSAAAKTLGKAEFTGVCATCHGLHGEGGYGPNLSHNPLLTQPGGLAAIIRDGRGRMPAVGDTWTVAQLHALEQYAKLHVYKGAATVGS
jgi:cytochrome c oxidase subunit 2